ncbi:MAG TPA: SRPBCC family protein [Micromonosporaceae bacterium]|nr:SRPBCC family protein [Micromonosporaceae bacterium]
MTEQITVPTVQRSVTVAAPVAKAFQVFTRSFTTWWPADYHIGEAEYAEAVMEGRTGGRWYERGVDGSECDWGRVLTWDPPNRVVLAWHINGEWQFDPDPARASEVEVTFTAEDDGRTRVDLEHRLFERHGEQAESVMKSVSEGGGWGDILQRYADAVSAS